MTKWRLEVAASAERTLARLPHAAAAAVVELMVGALVESPTVIGKPLRRELDRYWSAGRGAYRVIYHPDDEACVVTVVLIEHRADVYRHL